ncbi:MAG: hypothetical protein DRJ40_09065 [Thermoprotei archaeon]|nr:MAG: hypothetical protein DRJ40_09065 [Thermoprotei archaeon]
MKVLELDERHHVIRVVPECSEDLFFLTLLIEPGDVVYSWTYRMLKREGVTGTERGERVKVYMGLRVLSLDFQRFTNRLRIHGVVIEVPDWLPAKGRHHTIAVEPGVEVKIVKEHFNTSLIRGILEQCIQSRAKVLVISIDLRSVCLAEVTAIGSRILYSSSLSLSGKLSHRASLLNELEATLRKLLTRLTLHLREYSAVAIAVPSVLKSMVLEALRKVMDLSSINFTIFNVGEGGESGVYELLRRDDFCDYLKKVNVHFYSSYVEKLFRYLATDEAQVAIGIEEVKEAVEYHAVDTLIMTSNFLTNSYRSEDTRTVLERLGAQHIKVIVIPSEEECGQKLDSLGGIAAFLRFKIRT